MPLHAVYRIQSEANTIEQRAQALAVEQTIEFPPQAVSSPYIHRDIIGTVESIEPIDNTNFRVRITYSDQIVSSSIAQWLTVLIGNASLYADVELIDFHLSDTLTSLFPGPRYGIAGIRKHLAIPHRALSCAVLKPMGLSTDELCQRLQLFADNGIDIIKEDHGLSDLPFAPFADRVQRCQEWLDQFCVQTGRTILYVPCLNADPKILEQQLQFCEQLGICGVLLMPAVIGLPMFADICRSTSFIIMAHPALSGIYRWTPHSLLGKMFRLLGADIVIFPHSHGRFGWSTRQIQQLVTNLRSTLLDYRPALPAPAGGLKLTALPSAFDVYGNDTLYMIGGDLFLQHHPTVAIAQFVETIHRLSQLSVEHSDNTKN